MTELPKIRFNVHEAAGSVGDFGTILPIVLGVALVSDISLGTVFLFFTVWFVVAGIFYRLPVPIEPMKAVGAVVIAEGLAAPEIAASGIIIGVIFLLLGITKSMGAVQKYIPQSVIRGVQLGLALLLLKTSFGFVVSDLLWAAGGIAIILLFWIGNKRWSIPDVSALVVLFIGIGAGILAFGALPPFALPLPHLIIPGWGDFTFAAWQLVLPQIPLTLTNAILATSLLTIDLYRNEIKPDRLSTTIGIMNLVSCPLGGFPMCHGAGGLAAQHRFGARTGGACIIAGIILFGFALFFASPEMLTLIPIGIFGALLIFVAIALGEASLKTESYLITAVTGILAIIFSMTIGFLAGLALAYILAQFSKEKPKKSDG